MNSRKWVRMFMTTLALGGTVVLIASFFFRADAYMEALDPLQIGELFGVLIFFLGYGLIFSVISQMGFFAYLMINQFATGMFRGFWRPLQAFLIIFTLFDLVYFRYLASDDGNIWGYLATAAGLLVASYLVAKRKVYETNKTAFLPAMFFMTVITTVEWLPGLYLDDSAYTWLMIIGLFVCNSYQLLLLHRLVGTAKEA
ncbi:KinB-signaling pathway activation protein [Salimicrobium humidisoli]|uniref:KinB-signaling pathway activation protein n=1 Tax=Salimicrobium humidisoli TaxID=2029857 RepID=A0ABX4HPT4_9BACI|nr:KinB-signaling pathway activation protein [Salimicrobium humidisoli]PBB05204.1 KinB-signaling pathway activation protein [Salimicrobium humidisoli]